MFVRSITLWWMMAALALPASAAGFRDALDIPALKSSLAARSQLSGLATAGKRAVAVGQRGHILYSDEQHEKWLQALVPVSSDLVAVSFPTPQKGWAVGHDGVVLHSSDGGVNWSKQLDGRLAGKLMETWYAEKATKGELGKAPESEKLLDEIKRQAPQMVENPFLDVWFSDENTGYIVGAFNVVFRTQNGGKNWEPWFHLTENPGRLHLHAVRGVGAEVYIAGEQGLVMKLDAASGRFKKLNTPYQGSWFGLVVTQAGVLAHGLRGNAFRSTDGGKNWSRIETGLQEGLTAATILADGGLILASQSGQILLSRDGGATFAPVKLAQTIPTSAVIPAGDNKFVQAGPRGLRAQALR